MKFSSTVLVSVITPTYNRGDLLPRAAQSVFRQTYDPIEYVVVDDGSTDDTKAVVDELEYENLRYVDLEQNRGVAAARNAGIEAASGRWILFLDSDDALPRTAIATLAAALRAAPDRCAGVFGNLANYVNGRVIKVHEYADRIEHADLRRENLAGGFPGKLLRKRVVDDVGAVDTSFPSSEDFDFFLRMAKRGYLLESVDEITYHRYLHDDRLTGNTWAEFAGHERVLAKHGDELTARHTADRLSETALICANCGETTEALARLRRCISLYPYRPAYYAYFGLVLAGVYGYVSTLLWGAIRLLSLLRRPSGDPPAGTRIRQSK